jgi:hypothetical protein
MSLFVNMLFEWNCGTAEVVIERVLWVNPTGTTVVTIQINNPKALPRFQDSATLELLLEEGKVCELKTDPFAALHRPECFINDKERSYRDKAWSLIAPLVNQESEYIFVPKFRGRLISDLVKHTGQGKAYVYSVLRKYWQRGLSKNALLPRFDNCGGRGKKRRASTVKLGRPSKLSKTSNQERGINVNDDVLQRFRCGIKLFFENRQARTLKGAYQLTLEKFFHNGYALNRNDVLVPVLPPAADLPTYTQFKYWYKKDRDIKREKVARYGESRYNLKHREVLGNSTQMAFGPGSIYQIDATIGDLYLVSSLDRTRIIGRPVIYILIDVFSRLITGFSVSLEGPSWIGVMLAIENSTADKVAFCQEYGFAIEEHEWPSHHICEGLLADRGELEGYNADQLVDAFNIRVYNTPPWRADWKGIVEQNFDLCNERMIRWVPGAVRHRERGDRDYRLDAVIDLHEFRQMMIACVLDHNNQHRMDWYPKDEFMIADHVEPYPAELWHWGVKNRNGHLRKVSQDIVRLNLLPEREASITHRGIRFEGRYYTCDLALNEQWFIGAKESGTKQVRVSHDPRNVSHIYLKLGNGRRIETCHLINPHGAFSGRDWYEVADELELRKQAQEASQTRKQHSQAEHHAQINVIIAEANKKTQEARSEVVQSDRALITGIRDNRRLEREVERINATWELGNAISSDQQSSTHIAVNTEQTTDQALLDRSTGYVPPPQPIAKLRKLRERRLPNGK